MATQSHRSNGPRGPRTAGPPKSSHSVAASVPKLLSEWNEGVDDFPQDEQYEAARQLDRNPARQTAPQAALLLTYFQHHHSADGIELCVWPAADMRHYQRRRCRSGNRG